jgi:hypothetical protein
MNVTTTMTLRTHRDGVWATHPTNGTVLVLTDGYTDLAETQGLLDGAGYTAVTLALHTAIAPLPVGTVYPDALSLLGLPLPLDPNPADAVWDEFESPAADYACVWDGCRAQASAYMNPLCAPHARVLATTNPR